MSQPRPIAVVWPVVAGISVALLSTTGLGLADSWFDEQRAAMLVLLVASSLWLLTKPDQFASMPLWLAAAMLLGLISAMRTDRPFVSALDWAVIALMAQVIVAHRGQWSDRTSESLGVFALSVAGCYVAGVAARYISAVVTGFPVGTDTFIVGFSNPRFPAQLQALTLPLLPLASTLFERRRLRLVVAASGAGWWCCLYGSGSRTAWLALAVSVIAVVAVSGKSRDWVRWQVLAALAGAGLYLVAFFVAPAALELPTALETGRLGEAGRLSIQARLDLWNLSFDAAKAEPFLGIGPMGLASIDNGLGAHPHNVWLQLLAEWGVPAVVAIAAGLALLLAQAIRGSDRIDRNDLATPSVLAALVAWMVGASLDGYAVIPLSQLAATVVLGAACARFLEKRPPSLVSGIPAALVTVVAAMLIGSLPFSAFGRPAVREQAWRLEHPTDPRWPRFWQQGWIGPDADPTAR
jgi:O-antigen ligase